MLVRQPDWKEDQTTAVSLTLWMAAYIVVRAIIGIATGRTIRWYKVEVEERLATLTQTPVPIDHGKRPQTECTDSNSAVKVYVWSRSVSVRQKLFNLVHDRICPREFEQRSYAHLSSASTFGDTYM